MNISNVDLNLLKIFEVVFRLRNLSRAAEEMNISQPAMSNAVKRLRQIVGDPLFVREAHGVSPTARAKLMAPNVLKALDLVQTSLTEKHDFEALTSDQTFNIAMSDYGEYVFLPRLMKWITDVAPNIRINIWPIDRGQVDAELIDQSLDFAIGNIPYLDKDFRKQVLFDETFVCIARKRHPRVQGHISIEQLAEERHVRLTPRPQQVHWIDQAFEAHQLKRKVALQLPSYLSAPILVARTDYISIVPVRIAKPMAESFDLQVLSLPFEAPKALISQYWHEGVHQEPAHIWLRNALADICRRI